MKSLRTQIPFITLCLLLLIPLSLFSKGGKDDYNVVVEPANVSLNVGETQSFRAYLKDSDGNQKDTTFTWSIQGKNVGTISSNGDFTATASGKSKVLASAGKLKGTADVNVLGDKGKKGVHISVIPNDTLVAPGQSVQYQAVMTDSAGEIIDTTFTWQVEDDLGVIDDSTGLFIAGQVKAQGFVWALAGGLNGKGHVVIRDTTFSDTAAVDTSLQLIVLPADTVITPGSQIQMVAYLQDSLGNRTAVNPEWKVLAKRVGTITPTGLFTGQTLGTCLIRGKVPGYTGKTRVYIATEQQIANIDSAHFRIKDRHGNQVGKIKRLGEKDVLKISGMPFPLNILNGAELAIPPGSLDEDVSIDVTLPNVHEIKNDTTVTFADAILNGIAFHVYVGDSLVEHYDFTEPVQLTLPYKPELMEELGLTPDDLWIYFYTDSADYDSTGITDVVVDTVENKIYAMVHHFSEIVIKAKGAVDTNDDEGGSVIIPTGIQSSLLPTEPELYENYPNPFNPETLIRFYIPANATQNVSLRIYNMLGQEIKSLHNGTIESGYHALRWDGTNASGNFVGSGIYFYQLQTDTKIRNKRMILLR